MKKSLVKNYLYNVSLALLNILFPLITFPYIARVLGAEGVGKINYANSIVNYFLLLASLGIPVYGVREIAKVRNNRKKVSTVFSEIFTINLCSTILFTVIYYVMILNSPLFMKEKILFSVIGILLVLNIFNLDWLYQGFEEYRYITIRSVIFKVLSIIVMFMLIKGKGDYVNYALITVIALSGANILNGIKCRKYVDYSLKNINLKRHFKPVVIIFFMGLAINIYNNLDSTMLGLISGNESVGYYTAAVKINRMVINVVTSLGVVLLPRLSYYIEQNQFDEFKKIIVRSINFIYLIGLPSCVGLYMLAPSIIRLFSGSEFIPAIDTMRISIPIILFVSIANITSVQILLPLKKEKQVMMSVIFAALINLALNYILIPLYKQNGAAAASVVAECLCMVIQIWYCRKLLNHNLFGKDKIKYFVGAGTVLILLYGLNKIIFNDVILVVVSICACSIAYFIVMLFTKEETTLFLLRKFKLVK